MTGEERGLASYYITGRDGLNYSRHTRIHTNNSRNIYSSEENGNIAKHWQLGLNHCSVLYQEYCCLDLTDLYLLLFVLCFAHNKWARWQEHGVSLTRPDCINITISSHSLTTVNVNTCSTSSVVSTRRGEGEGE